MLLTKYASVRQQVIGSIDKSLLGYCCSDPFPTGIPFSSEDYWHVLRALPSVKPKVSGAAPALPPLYWRTFPRSPASYGLSSAHRLLITPLGPCALGRNPSSLKLGCLASLIPLVYVVLTPPVLPHPPRMYIELRIAFSIHLGVSQNQYRLFSILLTGQIIRAKIG